jgi:hypothetical protein
MCHGARNPVRQITSIAPKEKQAASRVDRMPWFAVRYIEIYRAKSAESRVDLTGFFIASLFVYKLLWGMGTQTHNFHPSKHPKEQ